MWSHVHDFQEQANGSLLTGTRASLARGRGWAARQGLCGSFVGREVFRIPLGLGFIRVYTFVQTFWAACVNLVQFALCKLYFHFDNTVQENCVHLCSFTLYTTTSPCLLVQLLSSSGEAQVLRPSILYLPPFVLKLSERFPLFTLRTTSDTEVIPASTSKRSWESSTGRSFLYVPLFLWQNFFCHSFPFRELPWAIFSSVHSFRFSEKLQKLYIWDGTKKEKNVESQPEKWCITRGSKTIQWYSPRFP